MASPRTRLRSKTPDPSWVPSKSPPPGRALKKAQQELKKRVSRSATPQRRLTFSEPIATVMPIEAENTARVVVERPAMSVADSEKILQKASRLPFTALYTVLGAGSS